MPLDPRDLGPPDRLLQARLLELKREQWRRVCRTSLLPFAIEALSPKAEVPAAHHRLIITKLEALMRAAFDRLLIVAPPGSAKTTYVSRLFPAHYFATHPRAHIIGASHTMELAATNSGHVQRTIRDNAETLGYTLANDNRTHWFTSTGAEYLAAGTGGVIRGFRADIVIIDDPIKSRAEAESDVEREALWTWYKSDLIPRLTPSGRIVLIGTAYHEDDLLARIQRVEGERWHVLRLPAICDEVDDPLGRALGEPLWGDDPAYGYGATLLALQATAEREGALRDWFSQYQCSPRVAEGNMFKPGEVPFFDTVPAGCTVMQEVRGWDLAASEAGDWTATVKLGRVWGDARWDGLVLVLDARRLRGRPDEVSQFVDEIVAADGVSVTQWFPEDPGQAGKYQAGEIVKRLFGHAVFTERMSGPKESRAAPFAAQLNQGRVGMFRAAWNGWLVDELASFPRGRYDDDVDAASLAFSHIGDNDISVWSRMAY